MVSWDIDHDAQGFYSIDDSHQAILGERYFDGVFDRTARFLVRVDRPIMGSGTYPGLAELHGSMDKTGHLVSSNAPSPNVSAAGLEFKTVATTSGVSQSRLTFIQGVAVGRGWLRVEYLTRREWPRSVDSK